MVKFATNPGMETNKSYTILAGTNKGLVEVDLAVDGEPKFTHVHFKGFSVTMIYRDTRNNRWWAGIKHRHWGQKLHYSDDLGATWQEAKIPTYSGYLLPDGNKAMLRDIWCLCQGGTDHPDRLWMGTDPGGLFRSDDNGNSFRLVESLWDHPSRREENQWFGAGSDYPFIHSIVLDPGDSDHLYVAVSCAGVFESKDCGNSWIPRNKGLIAAYLPNPNAEVGHDPHHLLMHKENTDVLWQQNHCGIFHSKNAGLTWDHVSAKKGVPDYGFCLVIDDHDPAKAWVIPAESDECRIAPGLRLQVYQTLDYGGSWEEVSTGLPLKNTFDIVLRQAFARKGNLMVFGTVNGNLYYSEGNEIRWQTISTTLTKVNTITIVD